MSLRSRALLIPAILLGLGALFLLLVRNPADLANTTYLGGIVALEIAFAGLARFEDLFFPLLMSAFLLAGMDLPFYSVAVSLRWLLLAVGALGGFLIWLKSPQQRHFGSIHLVAGFCVVAALVSATVSETPRTAVLKALSLFLLFLYAVSGARLMIAGREHVFVNRLVLACEALAYFSAACYFVLRFDLFGNPNALGAIMGVVLIPIMLWAALVAESERLRRRRFLALALCGALLYYSASRASILAAVVTVVVFTLAIRHQRLLFQCALVSVFLVTLFLVVNPSRWDSFVSTVTERVYKQTEANPGVFGSRVTPWAQTISVVKQHPWFGSGFGTSDLGELRPDVSGSELYTRVGTNREHGNSYLAMAEYMGLLGAAPFVILLLMVLRVTVRTLAWVRKTAGPYHFAVPFALVATAGLVHASLEDWLFAVGSYLCVFFWVAMFLLVDLAPDPELARAASVVVAAPDPSTVRQFGLGAGSILTRIHR